MEADMTERSHSVPGQPLIPHGTKQPHEDVIAAISELADHVRAYGLYQADDMLTELLAILYAEHEDD
jgi:hypothetical protein